MSGKNYPSSTINRRKQGDGGPPGKRRNVPAEKILNVRRTAQLRSAESSIAGIIFVSLLAFRIFNALAIRTFFQPDEYYQALEPAWKLAAGPDSGAWITWEWRNQLRSSLHPLLFAWIYRLTSTICNLLSCSDGTRASFLVAAPKVAQAFFAALSDWCTWELAQSVYGSSCSEPSWITLQKKDRFFTRNLIPNCLVLTICSPWQWFCSTRTFSNSLENTLTISALSIWPWHMLNTQGAVGKKASENSNLKCRWRVQTSYILAALAVILRPTNIIIWLCVAVPTLYAAHCKDRQLLISQALICGSAVLLISILSDRIYYDSWTFPPLRFVYFNIAQSLAVFYGANRPEYYFTEGLPLLLTTALPFSIYGLWQALSRPSEIGRWYRSQQNQSVKLYSRDGRNKSWDEPGRQSNVNGKALRVLASACVIVPCVLSLIGHKEVRFIYPLLPLLHVLAGPSLASLVLSSGIAFPSQPSPRRQLKLSYTTILLSLLAINMTIGFYVSRVHQRGVVDVVDYLRQTHEQRMDENLLSSAMHLNADDTSTLNEEGINTRSDSIVTTFAVAMPCHSTPWRSHLIHKGLQGWALTCEPPIGILIDQRTGYLDEADQFYADPVAWLRENMQDAVVKAGKTSDARARREGYQAVEEKRAWPMYWVLFAQLEDAIEGVLREKGYERCWRAFNSHWHDDWRRRGDVVVWCLASTE